MRDNQILITTFMKNENMAKNKDILGLFNALRNLKVL